MAPRGRFELPTFRLTAERSTIELPGNGKQTSNLQYFAGLDHRVWASGNALSVDSDNVSPELDEASVR